VATPEKPVLSFANDGDGSAGRNFVIHTSDFYINASRTALRVIDDRLNLRFVLLSISGMKEKYKFSYTFKANKQNLACVAFKVPVGSNRLFDIDAQLASVEQYELIEQLKEDIRKRRENIRSIPVDIDLSGYSIVYKPLSEVLVPIKGKSLYTRKYGEANKGDYPVFSASSATPLTYIDTYDYDGDYLSWSTNGFAGTVTVLKGRFSTNGDRGLLVPKIGNVDILYLRYVLEPVFRELAKGRKGDRGEDEFTKLYPSMITDIGIPLPIDENADISLAAQKEIAAMYDTVEQYRREVLEKLDALLAQRIEY